MGLFGRDDRNSSTKNPVAEPAPRATPKTSHPGPVSHTTLSPGLRFTGKLSGADDIRVEGSVEGSIDAEATVLIAEQGTAKAEVRGASVVVAGNVEGDIFAKERIELAETAVVRGNITAPKITIQEGATFEGQVFMKSPGAPAGKKPGSSSKKR